jgi:hypothetical protein
MAVLIINAIRMGMVMTFGGKWSCDYPKCSDIGDCADIPRTSLVNLINLIAAFRIPSPQFHPFASL